MEKMETVEVVYLGRRTLKGGKLGASFVTKAQLEALEHSGAAFNAVEYAASVFDGKGAPRSVGAIYSVEGRIEDNKITTIRYGTLRFEGMSESSFVAPAVAEDRIHASKKQAKLEEAKAAKDNPLDRALDQLAIAYRSVAPSNRQAFKVMVLDRIERGRLS